MTLSLKHAFNSVIADDAADSAAGKVTPTRWNAEHTITGTANALFGFSGAGAGIDLTGTSWDATNQALTITSIANPAASTLTLTGGTALTTSQPVLNMTQGWAAGLANPTTIKLNVTDGGATGTKTLIDLQINSTSKIQIKDDTIAIVGSTSGGFALGSVSSGFGFGYSGTNLVGQIANYSFSAFGFLQAGGFGCTLSGYYAWANGNNWGGNDTFLYRDGTAGIIAQRNSTNAQSLRVYNTYTDASNYERGVLDWQGSSNVLTMGTEKAGTGSTRNVRILIGGTSKADYGISTSGRWTLADGITTAGGATFLTTNTALTDGAAAATGTLTNAPAAGNPTKWIGINDNGTTRYIPAW